jgi:hypothetical protein
MAIQSVRWALIPADSLQEIITHRKQKLLSESKIFCYHQAIIFANHWMFALLCFMKNAGTIENEQELLVLC